MRHSAIRDLRFMRVARQTHGEVVRLSYFQRGGWISGSDVRLHKSFLIADHGPVREPGAGTIKRNREIHQQPGDGSREEGTPETGEWVRREGR